MWALLLCEHGPPGSISLFLPQVASWWRQVLAFVSRQKATVASWICPCLLDPEVSF